MDEDPLYSSLHNMKTKDVEEGLLNIVLMNSLLQDGKWAIDNAELLTKDQIVESLTAPIALLDIILTASTMRFEVELITRE